MQQSLSNHLSNNFLMAVQAIDSNDAPTLSRQYEELQKQLTIDQMPIFISIRSWKFPLATRCLSRYHQLRHIDSKKCGFSDADKAFFALFIEKVIHGIKRTYNAYFKKTLAFDKMQPSRSLQYNVSEKATYILLKTHFNTILDEGGSYKKVTAAIRIPDNPFVEPAIVAQSINKTSQIEAHPFNVLPCLQSLISNDVQESYIIQSLLTRITYKETKTELDIHKKFSGNRGIWPAFGSVKHRKYLKNGDNVQKISLFTPLASSCLDSMIENKEPLSTGKLINIMDQVAHGIDCLHTAGYLHGDLNSRNILFTHLSAETLFVGLTDFGFSFAPFEVLELPEVFNQGYYGSLASTAPELFGDKNFSGDLFKAEIWACGVLFYSLFHYKSPPWKSILLSQRNELQKEISSDLQQSMIELVEQTIEIPRKILVNKSNPLSIKEELLLLIYDMMSLNPAFRPTPQKIIQRLEKLEIRDLCSEFSKLSAK